MIAAVLTPADLLVAARLLAGYRLKDHEIPATGRILAAAYVVRGEQK